MRKITYRPVFNRKKQLDAQGKALLQIEAYLERKKIYFSTYIYLTPEQWDNKMKLVKQHPNAESLNYKIREFIFELEKKELSIWRTGKVVTLQTLKDEFQIHTPLSFLSFIKEDIESSQTKESTKHNRLTTYSLLSQFKKHIEFNELTSRLIYDFEKFLFSKRLKTNTVAKHMKHLKAFVNSAIDKGYLEFNDYPFRRYHIKTTEAKHTFLLPEELEKLEKLELSGRHKRWEHSLDAFLFCCYTGMRYSDFVNLSEKKIITIKNEPWLVFETIKTGIEIRLPLNLLFEGKAWKLLRKHKEHLSSFFCAKPNSTLNKELIRIKKKAGIEKHFSFHSARHTFATLLLYKGANITTVQKLLGHRDIATTQIYSKIMESTVVRDLKKCAKG